MSPRAHIARGATLPHRGWGAANEARNKLRYVWRDFFTRFDVLLAPVAATAAFPHDHNPDRGARRVIVNGTAASACRHYLGGAGGALLSAGDRGADRADARAGCRSGCRSSARRAKTRRRSNSPGCSPTRSAALCRRRATHKARLKRNASLPIVDKADLALEIGGAPVALVGMSSPSGTVGETLPNPGARSDERGRMTALSPADEDRGQPVEDLPPLIEPIADPFETASPRGEVLAPPRRRNLQRRMPNRHRRHRSRSRPSRCRSSRDLGRQSPSPRLARRPLACLRRPVRSCGRQAPALFVRRALRRDSHSRRGRICRGRSPFARNHRTRPPPRRGTRRSVWLISRAGRRRATPVPNCSWRSSMPRAKAWRRITRPRRPGSAPRPTRGCRGRNTISA